MTSPLDDERIQFFLRHRDDIKAWADIEPQVAEAVREILAGLQPEIEERLQAVDADVSVARRDNKNWERIQAYRGSWPDWCGVTLEWLTDVDPFGSSLPKLGVFIVGEPDDVDAGRQAFVEASEADSQLARAGYRVTHNKVWPVAARVEKSRDWWKNPDGWTDALVEDFVQLWSLSAPLVGQAFLTADEM
jgi:hypothetical protein